MNTLVIVNASTWRAGGRDLWVRMMRNLRNALSAPERHGVYFYFSASNLVQLSTLLP